MQVHVALHDSDTADIIIERTRFTANNATEAGALAVVGTCRPNLYARCRQQSDRAVQATTRVVNCSFVRNTGETGSGQHRCKQE